MSLVNQMLQELDKRGQANAALVAAVPYGVNATAPDPGEPVAARSRKIVFAVSALAAAIAAAWYWPPQQAEQLNAPATQQVASRPAQQASTEAIASPPLRAPVVAPVTPPAELAGQPARSPEPKEPRKASAAKVAVSTGPAPKAVTAPAPKSASLAQSAVATAQPNTSLAQPTVATAQPNTSLAQPTVATAQPNTLPTQPTAPPALATAIAADTAKAGEADASVHAAPAKAAVPAASLERAVLPNNNAVAGVQRQTRQPTPLDSADAAYREGLARFNAGDSAQAVRSFRAALAENPRHRRATEALAAIQVERREWGAALATLRDALAIDPKQPSLAMLAARLLARDGNREAAVLTLKAATDDTSPADAHAALAALLGELKRDREAIPYWMAALKKLPDRAVWWLGLAVALETDHRLADARAAYERAIALGGLRGDSADFARTRFYALR